MDLLSLIPAGSVGGTLVIVIVYLLRQNAVDRKAYRDELAATNARHTTALVEMETRHTAAIQALETKVDEALEELEEERRKRWKAEDIAARYRQQYGLTEEHT